MSKDRGIWKLFGNSFIFMVLYLLRRNQFTCERLWLHVTMSFLRMCSLSTHFTVFCVGIIHLQKNCLVVVVAPHLFFMLYRLFGCDFMYACSICCDWLGPQGIGNVGVYAIAFLEAICG